MAFLTANFGADRFASELSRKVGECEAEPDIFAWGEQFYNENFRRTYVSGKVGEYRGFSKII